VTLLAEVEREDIDLSGTPGVPDGPSAPVTEGCTREQFSCLRRESSFCRRVSSQVKSFTPRRGIKGGYPEGPDRYFSPDVLIDQRGE